MFLFPIRVDVDHPITPMACIWLIGAISVISLGAMFELIPVALLEPLVLGGWNPLGWVGSVFLHAGWEHLIFNMIYLWVFGTAVCSRVGNKDFLLLFFGLEIFSSFFHMMIDGRPAIGASGAISGLIGFYFALFPKNRITILFWFLIWWRTFAIAGFWVIGFWFLSDLWGGLAGGGDVAYWSHLGGFLSGLAAGLVALTLKWVWIPKAESKTLLGVFS